MKLEIILAGIVWPSSLLVAYVVFLILTRERKPNDREPIQKETGEDSIPASRR